MDFLPLKNWLGDIEGPLLIAGPCSAESEERKRHGQTRKEADRAQHRKAVEDHPHDESSASQLESRQSHADVKFRHAWLALPEWHAGSARDEHSPTRRRQADARPQAEAP